MVSLQARFFRRIVRQVYKPVCSPGVPLEKTERVWRRGGAVSPVEIGVTKEWVQMGDLKGKRFVPSASEPDKLVILYIHGGGYVVGNEPNTYDPYLSYVCKKTRATIWHPYYRLATEQPYPAAIEDTVQAYRWLLDQGTLPENIAFAGDSAGGGLTLGTLFKIRELSLPMPYAVWLISPWADLTHSGESHITNAHDDPWLTTGWLQQNAELYASGHDLRNPCISPIYGDFSGLPPTLIHVGTHEILLDDSRTLAKHMRSAGVEVSLSVTEGMWHVFPVFTIVTPESHHAADEGVEFLQKHHKSC